LGEEKALSVSEFDADVARKLALYAAVDFQPYCAAFGGIVAQVRRRREERMMVGLS